MQKNHSQQNQNLTEDIKIVKRIYEQKFNKSHSAQLLQKKRISVFQFKKINENQDLDILDKLNWQRKSKLKSKSVGSLLPKIIEIQKIAKSQKNAKQKQKSKQLTSFQVYLSQKFIKKQEQLNILFLTQTPSIIPDKVINDKFTKFLTVHHQNKPKNLRALLNLAGAFQNTQEAKQRKLEQQKKQLEMIAKKLIQEQNKLKLGPQIKQQSQSQESIDGDIHDKDKVEQNKNIKWVLNECRKYEKIFKVNKKKKMKAVQK